MAAAAATAAAVVSRNCHHFLLQTEVYNNYLKEFIYSFLLSVYYRVFSLLLVVADIVIVIIDLATAGHDEQVNDDFCSMCCSQKN